MFTDLLLLSFMLTFARFQIIKSSYSIQVNNTISLSNTFIQIIQFSNSSILIEYTNGTFVMYDNSLKYYSHFNIYTNNDTTRNFLLSQDELYFMSTSLTSPSICYTYNISKNSFFEGFIVPTILVYNQWIFPTFKVFLSLNSTTLYMGQAFGILNRNYPSTISYPDLDIRIWRNAWTVFINCTTVNRHLNMRIYCFTNFNEIIQINATVSVSNTYNTHSFSKRSIYNYTTSINKLIFCNNILLIHDSNNEIAAIDLIFMRPVSFPTQIQSLGLVDITYLNYYYYLLISSQLNRMTYNNVTYTFIIAENIQNDLAMFPTASKVNLKQNSGLNMLSFVYIAGTNKLYSFKQCSGNNRYNLLTDSCDFYTCTVINCVVCNFGQNICTQCNTTISPLVINNFYQCQYPRCAVINCTYCFNLTFCSICVTGFKVNIAGLCQEIVIIQIGPPNNLNTSNSTNINNRTNRNNNRNSTNGQSNNSYYKQQAPSQQDIILYYIKKAIAIPAIRNHLPFIAPFMDCFDDYWYYIYQDNQMNNLTVFPYFLNLMYQANNDRFSPQIVGLQKLQVSIAVNSDILQSYFKFTNQRVHIIDQNITFFYENCYNLIVIQNFLVIACVIILSQLNIILKRLHNCAQKRISQVANSNDTQNLPQNLVLKKRTLLQKSTQYLTKKTSFQNLILMLFQGNLVFLGFYVGLQLNILIHFSFIHKLNLLLTILYGFIAIFIGFTFYIIVGRKQTQFCGQKSLLKLKFNQLLNKTVFVGFKGIAYGFIHSILIDCNQAQYISLILVKIVLFGFLIMFPSIYEHKILKFLYFGYVLAATGIDTLLFCAKVGYLTHVPDINIVLITQYIFLSIIILCVTASVFAQLIFQAKQIIFQRKSIGKSSQNNNTANRKKFAKAQAIQNWKRNTQKLKFQSETCKSHHFEGKISLVNIIKLNIRQKEQKPLKIEQKKKQKFIVKEKYHSRKISQSTLIIKKFQANQLQSQVNQIDKQPWMKSSMISKFRQDAKHILKQRKQIKLKNLKDNIKQDQYRMTCTKHLQN